MYCVWYTITYVFLCFNSCSNHWICVSVDVKVGIAWVLDSLGKDEETYKDFICIVQAYMNHPH